METEIKLRETVTKFAPLKFQLGYFQKRAMLLPVFTDGQVTGHVRGREQVRSWHVVAFGSTLEKAERMLAKWLTKRSNSEVYHSANVAAATITTTIKTQNK
jgi:hypothetical protein